MDEVLSEALEPVCRDLERSGLQAPRLEDREWNDFPGYASAVMWAPDGSGRGVSVDRTAPAHERVAAAADQVQEQTIESQLWGVAETNWPRCPEHPHSHPLEATTSGEAAVWVCPASRSVVAPIGGL